MAMMKAGLAGAAVGALALATLMFVAPIAAQGPSTQGPVPQGPSTQGPVPQGGPPYGPEGFRGPGWPSDRGPRGPGMMEPGRDMGPGTMGRRGFDPNDPDITGPRGEVGFCQDRLAQVAQRRLERIQRLVRPTDEQRIAFEELRMASAKAVEIMRAACPIERPLTPTGRMAAAEKRLEARLQAIRTVRPALESFYKLLSDEQKIRWITGPREEGRWGGDERERWQPWRRPDWERGEDRWRRQDRGDWHGMRRDPSDQWHERRHDWHEGFDDRGRKSWRDDGRGWDDNRWDDRSRGENRWRDQDRSGPSEPRRRDERGRSAEPDEERL